MAARVRTGGGPGGRGGGGGGGAAAPAIAQLHPLHLTQLRLCFSLGLGLRWCTVRAFF